MLDLLTTQLEMKRRKKPIKISDRLDFLGIVIISMFGIFTKRNSLEESKIINILYQLDLIKLTDINNLKILDILFYDGLIDYYASNKNIKLTDKGKEFNKYLKTSQLFNDLQNQLRELL